jgi:hypothetical protein
VCMNELHARTLDHECEELSISGFRYSLDKVTQLPSSFLHVQGLDSSYLDDCTADDPSQENLFLISQLRSL